MAPCICSPSCPTGVCLGSVTICSNGVCFDSPACVNGACAVSCGPCSATCPTGTCPAGQTCQNGVCAAGSSGPCAQGSFAVLGTCVPQVALLAIAGLGIVFLRGKGKR